MNIALASNFEAYERFLLRQDWSPFLQSWTMGEAYRAVCEEPVRITVEEKGEIVAICQAIVVPAKRGRHLMVQYGPVIDNGKLIIDNDGRLEGALRLIVDKLHEEALKRGCAFVRVSPFWENNDPKKRMFNEMGFRCAPLHLLAEHIWHLDLRGKSEEEILKGMRSTTRNLIHRAEREGVTVEASNDPVRDLPIFFSLYEETRKRHHFVPYSRKFIEAQVAEFSQFGNSEIRKCQPGQVVRLTGVGQGSKCSLYIARYHGEPVASSIHIHYGGETSYHHGASTAKHPKCFASYLLQWTAIRDAMRRGDWAYNFWGIAPVRREESGTHSAKAARGKKWIVDSAKHPFAGVTLFKTGFGGELLELAHCMDLPISYRYWFTWCIEMIRKWRRGF